MNARATSQARIGAIAALIAALPFAPLAAQTKLPPGFIFLHDVDPDIAQDMRYASENNFVGRRLPGYNAAECVLRRDVAMALKRVQEDLAGTGYSIKVYDCYRPQRAVRAMVQWAYDGQADGPAKRFYPGVSKNSLFAAGFISAHSAHSSGTAVDLTLVPENAASAPRAESGSPYGPCNGPAARRAPDSSVDMGTEFDCFDRKSFTRTAAITAEQRRHRALLVAVMNRRGFKNYFREWWHFGYGSVLPGAQYDFPIPRRSR